MIEFDKPTIRRNEMAGVLKSMVDEKLGPGESSVSFVNEFLQLIGGRSGAAFRSYIKCIESALILAGAGEGTKVAVSPLTPVVYADVLKKMGCVPVFVDVEKENGLPSASAVEQRQADILVLYDSCGSLAMKFNMEISGFEKTDYGNVIVIEDVSRSIGGRFITEEGNDDVVAGSWGKIVICSCEENDIVSCAGGAVLGIRDSSFAEALKGLRPSVYDALTDINASLGLVQMQKLEGDSKKRRIISDVFNEGLKTLPHRKFGLVNADFSGSSPCFPVFLNSKPEDVIKFAHKYGVPARKTFETSIASSYEGDIFEICPVAGAFWSRTVSFPLYPFLSSSEVDAIHRVISHLP